MLNSKHGFCLGCGAHLFFKLKKSGEYNMPVGIFQNLKGLKMEYFAEHI